MISVAFTMAGLAIGVIINYLASVLPAHFGPRLIANRLVTIQHQISERPIATSDGWRRRLVVIVLSICMFAILPLLVTDPTDQLIATLNISLLMLISVIDIEHRRILNVVSMPAMLLVLMVNLLVPSSDNSIWLSLLGMIVAGGLYYSISKIGEKLYGPGAMGYGDIKLAMLAGAMVGLHRILFVAILATLLHGIAAAAAIFSGKWQKSDHIPYGPFLASATIVILIWGMLLYRVVLG